MHHLFQLDCAAMPVLDPDMPDTGTLSIFITGSVEEDGAPDLTLGHTGAFCILYHPQAPSDLEERAHPVTCPALGDVSHAQSAVKIPVPLQKNRSFAASFGAPAKGGDQT